MKSLRIYAKKVELSDGKSFYTYGFKRGGTDWIVVKFRQGNAVPTSKGYYKVTFDELKCSISSKDVETRKGTHFIQTTLWLDGVQKIEVDEEFYKQVKESNLNTINSLIDEQTNKEELPF